ncbi:MAG TPA: hypothetical protein VMZ28_23235 [Kofleriaceae bacterium]|nr:hypothetical protein [Kofleriaceae bacterium]
MKRMPTLLRGIVVVMVIVIAACGNPAQRAAPAARGGARAPAGDEELAFAIREGVTDNRFYRRGDVAAHLLATSGRAPRLVVAFPAGNAGAGLWFDEQPPRDPKGSTEQPGHGVAPDVALEVVGALRPVTRDDGMRGVEAELRVGAASLRAGKVILGGNWSLREWVPPGLTFPPLVNEVTADGARARLARTMVDGAHHIEVLLEVDGGGTAELDGGAVVLRAAPGAQEIRVRVTATTDETPLRPIPQDRLLVDSRGADPHLLRSLAFLAYDDRLLAGSWRFLNYFGRDTLLSVRMLMPAARPELTEAGLASVIERLSDAGEVAHYEESGDFVALRNSVTTPRPADLRRPYHEYKMVDDDFMLAPVLAAYVATESGGARAGDFLARKTASGESYARRLRRNLDRVMSAARAYADDPRWQNLVAFDARYPWGEWRDSDDGNAGGRISYNVNAVLVPAALAAAGDLLRLPAMGPDLSAALRAEAMAEVWRDKAPAHFHVELSGDEARRRVTAYAKGIQLAPAEATGAIGERLGLEAIALDAKGQPIPIQHSDDGFALLFGAPPPAALDDAAGRILLPFPAGLRTPVGVVVANPAYADEALQARFTPAHYHGTVVWSWQQAMLAAGLRRQLQRTDLPHATRQRLTDAERALWAAIGAMRDQAAGELWSFKVEGGKIVYLPFGQARGHLDESNAVQIWSTVYLAVRPP